MTLSPVSTPVRFLRILPRCVSDEFRVSFSSLTRTVAFGRQFRRPCPSNSIPFFFRH